jgi:hypothetical protein
MFIVKWVARFDEDHPILTENDPSSDLDGVVVACQARLESMRARHATANLEGFIVCDNHGNELRRWIGRMSARPSPDA